MFHTFAASPNGPSGFLLPIVLRALFPYSSRTKFVPKRSINWSLGNISLRPAIAKIATFLNYPGLPNIHDAVR